MQRYVVIIGDIIQSRRLKNRTEVQEIFLKTIEKIKKEFSQMFISPPTITIGDEFQAVLKRTDNLFVMIHRFESYISPVVLRFGIGVGIIETPINTREAIGMDGSAFHNARFAIEEARTSGIKYNLHTDSADGSIRALELLLRWVDMNRRSWKGKNLEVLTLHRMGKNQIEIANALDISQPAVSQHINKYDFSLVVKSEVCIEEKLNQYLAGNSGEYQ